MTILAQGAEAIISEKDGAIVKERIAKTYRHPAIDEKLRNFRTRREVKILKKLAGTNFPSPRVLRSESTTIVMEKIKGPQLKDVLTLEHGKEIGMLIATMHKQDITHGDLTTSNMIASPDGIVLVDFGLAQFSKRIEDKAVDLHLLKHALESKHYQIADAVFSEVVKSYQATYPSPEIMHRFEIVEQRGRNKVKGA